MASVRANDRWGYLLILGIALTLFGYQALRGDEASRLFHMFAQLDPELFRKDWYVQGYQDVNPHAPYFFVLGGMTQILGVFPALLSAFLVWLLVLFYGSVVLYRTLRPQDPDWKAWLAVLTVIFCQTGNLGFNAIFESEFKPRMLANAFALVGFAILLQRPLTRHRAVLAGLCVALTILAHVGVGVLVGGTFGLMVIWWMARPGRSQVALDVGATFLLADAFALALRVPYLLGVDNRLASNAAELELMQKHYILSHAGHFYPPAWPWTLWCGAFALIAYAVTRLKLQDDALSFRLMSAGVTVGLILLGGLIVSSFLLVYKLVLLQPFRLVTLVRSVLAVLVAVKLGELGEGSKERWAWPRLLLLLTSLTDDRAFLLACATEVVGSRWRSVHPFLIFSAAVVTTGWLAPKTGLLFWASLAVVLVFRRLAARGVSVKLLALLALAVPLGVLTVQLISPKSELAKRTSVRWQFLGIPSLGLEPMADWCRRHTEPNTVFLTPPDIPGFRVWARRALVFDATTPPISGPEIGEFLQREREFSAPHESLEAETPLGERYRTMDSERILELCRKYGADCAVTVGPRTHPHLHQLHQEGDFYLYRVTLSSSTKVSSETATVTPSSSDLEDKA